jgi:hypothetical protein
MFIDLQKSKIYISRDTVPLRRTKRKNREKENKTGGERQRGGIIKKSCNMQG